MSLKAGMPKPKALILDGTTDADLQIFTNWVAENFRLFSKMI
jgi:hypothetical protein